MWASSPTSTSSPGRVSNLSAIWFAIVPLGTNSAASLPSSAAMRSCSRLTEGSSPYWSSPTGASAIARRMPGEGRVTVSERRSIGSLGFGHQRLPMQRDPGANRHPKTHDSRVAIGGEAWCHRPWLSHRVRRGLCGIAGAASSAPVCFLRPGFTRLWAWRGGAGAGAAFFPHRHGGDRGQLFRDRRPCRQRDLEPGRWAALRAAAAVAACAGWSRSPRRRQARSRTCA